MTQEANTIDFSVDQKNLYREEAITDMKVASIRRLIPIHSDGTEDKSRTEVFIGSTQLMSPQGPLPLQAALNANNFAEARTVFPEAMKNSMEKMIQEVKKMQEQKQREDASRIIVPGR